ncbi:heat-inducible transcriptional repressor HrcA [Mesorhizobium sp. B4-1-3]|uniref:heat-inducible transcriptional repressor HrcA n=1 Tax=Mesorhizobium sp. B4-1-3 TaxID=2589889 RepID=UPI0011296836|nr:heat-inducible transcriptional repressor HrcA [Mesorhizobium sp. B4-1-3]TPI13719.1 heat-inducible transcriptional repressor HrcA [Mesorhizobium sp. B4-1-3]
MNKPVDPTSQSPGLQSPVLQSLDMRSRDIFRRIVDSYLRDGEPVGSRSLSRILPSSLSPATIRNVMSDLEHLGLIYAPHVSAGRLPTQTGLRFFVDAFMELGDLSDDERRTIEAQVRASGSGATLEHMLTEASQMLSGMSRGAGLVLASKNEVALKHIEFIQLEPTKALAVLVSQNGDVENRVIDLPADITVSQLHEASNFLNAHIRGRTLAEARTEIARIKDETRAALDTLSQDLVEKGLAVWAGAESGLPARLIVRGRANLLENVTAQADLELLRHLFEDLETQDGLLQLLDLAEQGPGVRIFIGSENKLFSLSGSSLVVAPYRDKDARVVGALGVIGPTRLNYARIVPMVDYTAQLISRMLR